MTHSAARKTIVAPVPIADFYAAVVDYLAYPAITDEVKSARVLSREGPVAIVHFTARVLLKSFDYTLRMVEDPERFTMSWSLVSSSSLSDNRGAWTLEALSPSETRVTYENALGTRLWIPNSFVTSLSGAVLPKVMRRFTEYAAGQVAARDTRVA